MKVNLLGITFEDFNVKEGLRKANIYLKSGALNTIAYVSVKKLMQASKDEEESKRWEVIDLIVCEDKEVLEALNITARNRSKEVEENEFLTEFLKRIVRNQSTVFLLSKDQVEAQRVENELRKLQSGIKIVKNCSIDEYSINLDGLINDMNSLTPNVILSSLEMNETLKLMETYRGLLSAEVWMALPNEITKNRKNAAIFKFIKSIYIKLFIRKVNSFHDEESK
ncbi:MAG: WecB/TagA/CpsF family glycosyltransferase [Lachnospiraceae bacterium]